VLAWVAAGNDIDGFEPSGVNGSDIAISPHLRPVPLQHAAAVGVDLHLPSDLHPCALQR